MKDIAKGLVYLGIFAVPFIPLIIANSMFFPFITGKNFTFRIIVEIVFAAWVILALYEPRYRPKFSCILAGFASLLVVMVFANAFGADPNASFWSNYERMEGYVTLVHAFLFFLVMGSVLSTDKLWDRWFNATLAAGVILALYAFAQLSGNITINQGGWRLDGTLGNSAYMAIYTLFHVFIALYMLLRTKSVGMRYVYGALVALFTYLLIQTATRGTILGLVGGLGVTTAYIALFSTQYPRVRKFAAGGLITLVVIVGLFIAFRKSEFIQQNPYLGRVANITLSEGNVRFTVWKMAFEGFKERPVLGWGQSNFNYVFNKQFDPSIYFAEPWYDRVHNIVFDWLIAGGVLGFIAYFSILGAALFYLFIRPLIRQDESFTVIERGVILGLFAGYVFHNLFVFDNIVSYIYYAAFLGLIHARVASPVARVEGAKVDRSIIDQIAAPVVGVALVATLYFVNAPGILAARDIIDAFRTQTPEGTLNAFERALSRGSFADQEIREQMTRQAQNIQNAPNASDELKQRYMTRVEEELLKEVENKPDDARVRVFISSFYRMSGQVDKAIEQLVKARELSPKKQQIIFEQGLAHLQKGEYATATTLFKEAYELDTSYTEAKHYYAIGLLYDGNADAARGLLDTEDARRAFSQSDLAVQATYVAKEYPLLVELFKYRIEANPSDTQARTNLAYIQNESGDRDAAIETLNKAAADIPEFEPQAKQFIADLLMGKIPGQTPE
jgi:O-antigen ligase/Flp pilus assembly protein TadD